MKANPTPPALALALAFAATLALAHAKDAPSADPNELPRIPPTPPARAAETFEIRPGFALELVAHEPMVADPVAMAFDERGRLYVVEMRGYPERRDEALGRVKLLVDDDDDGVFDRAHLFAAGLKWPTSVCCFDGGVFVVASPDIWFLKDDDGDGAADRREVVFTGFGPPGGRLNMQALPNSLQWGPDNRIWGATAANGGRVHRPNTPTNTPANTPAVNLDGADFSFDPRKLDLRPENGTAQFGMGFDSQGRRFVCSNSNHIQWVAWERADAEPNPFFTLPPPLVSIAADGPAAPVFRISPDEPWRIVRTRWRVSGVTQGIVEGGGRVSGYFTAATGITPYTGDAFGPAFQDNAFVGDAGSNLVHRKIVRTPPGQLQPVAERPHDERETEFLRSRDNWFRPVSLANGPDGCLYLCDMYREVIEHPWSIPDGIKKHLDLASGDDRGRIWRIAPTGFSRPPFSLDRTTNPWQVATLRRLAYERGKPQAPRDPPARDTACRWGTSFKLNALTDPQKVLGAWEDAPPGDGTLRRALARMAGKTGDPAVVGAVVRSLAAVPEPTGFALLAALGDGLHSAGITFDDLGMAATLAPVFSLARRTAASGREAPPQRADALAILAFDRASAAAAAKVLSDADAPDEVRMAAMQAAEKVSPDFGTLVLDHWSTLTPALKTEALNRLAATPARARLLLAALDAGRLARADVPAHVAERLRSHRDAEVARRARDLLTPAPTRPPEALISELRAALPDLTGDPARGQAVFTRAACAACHRLPDNTGAPVGPDVVTFKNAGPESLLKNIFDPSAEVAPQYQAFVFELASGETVAGIIAHENATDVTVRAAGGTDHTFLRRDVSSMTSLGQSLMPAGLEATLSPQDVADLLAFIASVQ